MRVFLKIVATIAFFLIWGQLQRGCRMGAMSTGSGGAFWVMNLLGLIVLIFGVYAIWKFIPSENNNSKDRNNPGPPEPPSPYPPSPNPPEPENGDGKGEGEYTQGNPYG